MPGMVVGSRYELAEVIGEGGMGTVWRARDGVLRRDVAVKEVRLPGVLNAHEREVAVERSLREARAAAGINHPNVITVYDVVRQDERPWIVMEYLPCRSLEQIVAEDGPLSPERTAQIGLALVKALRAAHEAGIQHRDVKPSNVLIRSTDRVILTDFGIASISGDPSLTRSGILLGAPGYIAPERARGESGGPSADLWSLGATLYAAVEGRPLYDRGSALATLTAIVTEEVDPPTRAGALTPVLNGLLRRDPEERIDADRTITLLRQASAQTRRSAARRTTPAGPDTPSGSAVSGLRNSADGWPTLVDEVPGATPPDAEQGDDAPGSSRAEDPEPVPAPTTAPAPEQRPVPVTPAAPGASRVRPASAGRVGSTAERPGNTAALRTGPRRRPLWYAAAAVALVLVVGVVLVVRALQNNDSSGSGDAPAAGGADRHSSSPHPTTHRSGTGRPSASSSASSASSPSTAAGIPAGFHRYHDPSGFSIAVPNGWNISHDGRLLYVRDPHSSRKLMVDQTDQPKSDPVADWTQQEAQRKYGWSDYRRISIHAVDYFVKAADWEFTYAGDNGRLHVINRGVVTSSHKAYGLMWTAPDASWQDDLRYWRTFTGTLHPAS